MKVTLRSLYREEMVLDEVENVDFGLDLETSESEVFIKYKVDDKAIVYYDGVLSLSIKED